MNKRQERIANVLSAAISARESIIFVIAVALVIIFYFTSHEGRFISPGVLQTIFTAAPELGILTIGVTLLMISGEFDLSVGSVSGFCALLSVLLYVEGVNPYFGLIASLATGITIGLLNGLIVVKSGVPSFIITLGMLMAWRGAIYIVTAGTTVRFPVWQTHPSFYNIFSSRLLGIPVQLFWFMIITAAFTIILNHHRFGNQVYATGGNKEAAKAMGVNTDKVKIMCFMMVGLLASFAGVIRATRVRGFYAMQGDGMELMAIAAAVVGGTSLFGGVGTLVGAFLGVLVITFVEHGLIVSRIPGYWFRGVLGILIITITVVNRLMEKRKEHL